MNLAGEDQPPSHLVVNVVLSCVFLGCKTDTGLAAYLFGDRRGMRRAVGHRRPIEFPVKAISGLLTYTLGTQ